ncbi:hypothetical protein D7I46_08645 [Lactococcus allomyrinae]|uniref:Uncharacterized protein n=1 Tax=Lactococcus allomyrinae TaxID=2419773 RepID=A0A387BF03_9LACT|nr:hypothetical protein D7I46_08645 [Lactococcus allomyrinae]
MNRKIKIILKWIWVEGVVLLCSLILWFLMQFVGFSLLFRCIVVGGYFVFMSWWLWLSMRQNIRNQTFNESQNDYHCKKELSLKKQIRQVINFLGYFIFVCGTVFFCIWIIIANNVNLTSGDYLKYLIIFYLSLFLWFIVLMIIFGRNNH